MAHCELWVYILMDVQHMVHRDLVVYLDRCLMPGLLCIWEDVQRMAQYEVVVYLGDIYEIQDNVAI